ncbi:hypothetical protein ALC57_04273 [Trachymyrmex cornetzi]|uniref:Uncharacterized protein n=1 Tax=Trachymyrmex cornetzi TaxID=471704 RepID=A0A195EEW2_9HYME|nr:hypothetical protein ALC57_04273 [Trachymyrmex cornetzi]
MPRLRARPNSPSPKTPSTTRQRFRPSDDDDDDDDNDDDNDGAVRKSQTTRFAMRRTVYLVWRKSVVANTDSVTCSSQNYTKRAENTNSGEQTASRVTENRHLYKFTLAGRTGDPAEILVASNHCPCPRGKRLNIRLRFKWANACSVFRPKGEGVASCTACTTRLFRRVNDSYSLLSPFLCALRLCVCVGAQVGTTDSEIYEYGHERGARKMSHNVRTVDVCT